MPRKSEIVVVAQEPPATGDAASDPGREGEVGLDGGGMVKEGSAGKEKEKEKEKERESMGGGGVNVEDLNLPKSIVTRLAKGVLPPNTQIQGNAMLAMAKSATVFVNYLASHANEHTVSQSRKTISPQDVFKALEDIEFTDFKARLEAELARYNEVQTDKRNIYRKKVADKAAGLTGSEGVDEEGANGEGRDGQPAAKKARREGGGAKADGSGNDKRDAGGEMHEEESMNEQIGDDEEGDGEGEGDEEDEDEGEGDDGEEEAQEEQMDELEHEHEREQREPEDEALDNGEDSE